MHVAPGTYQGGFSTTASGTASGRIRYISDTKWGAKIVPSSSSSSRVAWDNRGNYVDIDGFDFDGQSGSKWTNGVGASGSHNVVKNNHIHHIADKVACSNQGGSAVNTNHYYYGVKNDVIGNVVHHIGSSGCRYIQGIYISTDGNVKNNLVYQIGGAAIHLWHDATNVNIANNTTFGSGVGIVVGGGGAYHRSGLNDYTHVVNNVVFDNDYGIVESGKTGTHNTYTNNLVHQHKNYNWRLLNGLTHTSSITADPQFVNYLRAGGGDYHLKDTSPAIDKGTKTHAPSTDLDGKVRPQGAAVDIGAYEIR